MTSKALWHADGLRWIGSLFTGAADRLERASFAPAPLEPRPRYLPADEYLFDVRHRMQNRF